MDYEPGTPADSDGILMPSEPPCVNGQQFTDFHFTTLTGFEPGEYDLIDFGSSSGSLGAIRSGAIDGYQANISVQGDNLVLTVVPEPRTLAILGIVIINLLFYGSLGTRSASLPACSRCSPCAGAEAGHPVYSHRSGDVAGRRLKLC